MARGTGVALLLSMLIHVGTSTIQLGDSRFHLDTQTHTAVFGKTGVGKSSLLARVIVSAIRNGEGISVLDPHGSLIDTVLTMVPRDRVKDTILFDPSLPKVIGLNIFEGKDANLALDTLITIIRKLWPDGWGPRTDQLITNAALGILELEKGRVTVVHCHKFFSNPAYRARVFAHSKNPLIKDFQQMYEEEWDKRLRNEATAAPANKFSKFLTNPTLRAVIGQAKSLNLRDVMDKRRILLAKLPKGRLGADVSSLLGSVLVSKMMLAALGREEQQEAKRAPHLLVADEVHNFTKGIPLDTILSEARKYRLSLVIATQTIEQLPDPETVFGNCSTVVSYRLGGKDAQLMADEFGGDFPATPLLTIPNYNAYATTVSHGIPVGPFTVAILPPIQRRKTDASKEHVIARSQDNWAVPKELVEAQIKKFLES